MPQTQNNPAPSTNEIAQRGEAIYKERYQSRLEKFALRWKKTLPAFSISFGVHSVTVVDWKPCL
jgi:hypothetical protein